jgi:hypothetical protein
MPVAPVGVVVVPVPVPGELVSTGLIIVANSAPSGHLM